MKAESPGVEKMVESDAELTVQGDSEVQAGRETVVRAVGNDSILPLKMYGAELSYFTGKLEGVLRYMELPYQLLQRSPVGEVAKVSDTAQVPALQIGDGRWLTDSTPIIAWLDQRYPELEITPRDPVLAFFSRLLEDYADEWLWRPAMHYRWDYKESAEHQSRVLADADDVEVNIPNFIKRYVIRNRQRKFFTRGDGITSETWDHVEKIYHDTLEQFSAILKTRPYLFGTRPSLADFGFFGPMFRHFAMDPTSARIMRDTAPLVFEWVARMWSARASVNDGELLDHVPDDLGPILDSIGTGYLPSLCANAEAWKAGRSHHDVDIEGAPYRHLRTSPYRVWCLEELRRHFNELSKPHQRQVRARLEAHGCWEPLWRVENPGSGFDPDRKLPFVGSGTMTGMSLKVASKLFWFPVSAPKRKAQRPKANMMGNVALITGASSGIGAEFARLHARRGGDVVLVARREQELNTLKCELENSYGISAAVIVADLTVQGAAKKVFAETEAAGLEIDILINNAGIGGHGKFHERDLASDQAMMQVNMNAVVELTHLYMQPMLRRNSGKILNVASTAGMMPGGPLQAVYYASKAFVISFSQAIAEELSGTGVTSTALCPGPVETGFIAAGDLQGTSLFEKPGASAVSVAESGYKAMLAADLVKVNASVLGFVLNWVIPLLPKKLALKISRKSMEKS